MFEKEIDVIGRIDTVVDILNDVTDELWNNSQDLDTCVNDFMVDENMMASDADRVFGDMVKCERDIAVSLAKFDRALNLVIAQRRKLGDFTITL